MIKRERDVRGGGGTTATLRAHPMGLGLEAKKAKNERHRALFASHRYFAPMNVLSAAMSPSTGRAKPGGRRASQYPAARALPMRPAHATWAGSQVSSVADRTLEMWVPRERWMPARGGEEKRCEGREREREREREGEAGPGALRNERGRGRRGPSLPSSRPFLSLGVHHRRRPPLPATSFSL